MRLAAAHSWTPFARAEVRTEVAPQALLRCARLLYYAGLLVIGHLTFRPALSLALTEYFFFAALLVTVPIAIAQRNSARGYRPAGILWGSSLFALGTIISSVGSPQPVQSIGVVARFAFLTLVWFWLGTVLLRRPEHVRTALVCWVLSLAASGAVALAQLLSGDGLVLPDWVIAGKRMPGLAQHVNDLGGSAAVAIVAAFWFVLRAQSFPLRLVALAVLVLVEAGLILSGSMGGLLAATVGVATLLVLARPSARIIAVTVFASVAAFGLVQVQSANNAPTPGQGIQRVRGGEISISHGAATVTTDSTLSVRMETYEAALSRVVRNPVVGVGPQPGGTKTDVGRPVYNFLLGTWYESGGLAALGMVLVVATSAMVALGARREARARDELLLATALLACFAAYLTFGMGTPTLYPRYGWVPVALLLALRAQQRRTDHEDVPA